MTYDPSRPGIPTLYNGIQFRSRLEAKWAAFFDLLGWKYEYEPFDLAGWIPDFLLYGETRRILVEVKPLSLFYFPHDVADKMEAAIVSAQEQYDLLIVGHSVSVHGGLYKQGFGWESQDAGVWTDAVYGRRRTSDPIGYYSDCHQLNRITDHVGGGIVDAEFYAGVDMDEIRDFWRQAGNMTQWKGKKSVSS